MKAVVFQLFGPMAAWGEVAVGEVRPSMARPGASTLLGLLAASLGITRHDTEGWQALVDGYRFAVEVWSIGRAEWDFHTIQTVKQATVKRAGGVRSRREELSLEPYTFTSRREHRTDGYWRAVVVPREGARWSAEEMAAAMRAPRFALFLGRRACPLALPLDPRVIEADRLVDALATERPRIHDAGHPGARCFGRIARRPMGMYWDTELDVGLAPQETHERRDVVLSRHRWQFTTRREHYAAFSAEE